jgi:hypothetical protein
VAEAFTNRPGVYVKLEDSIRGFRTIIEGEMDQYPEQAFYMAGTIDDVIKHLELNDEFARRFRAGLMSIVLAMLKGSSPKQT